MRGEGGDGMSNLYPVEVREVYKYIIHVKAKSKQEAIENARKCYECDEMDGVFLADANSHSKTTFSVLAVQEV